MKLSAENLPEHTELFILLLFLFTSGYFFVESFSFGGFSEVTPQITSAFVIICSILLIFRLYLPAQLHPYVKEDQTSTDGGKEEKMKKMNSRSTDKTKIMSGILIGYVLLGFIIGLLWATPLFLIAYSIVFNQRWYIATGLVILGTFTVILFMFAFRLTLTTGGI